jgi:glycerophosphoryl diester phosphodiesterase
VAEELRPPLDNFPRSPLAVAHRAGVSLANGDPVLGVRELVARGVNAIELDVRRTGDGVLVVNHDEYWEGIKLTTTSYHELTQRDRRLRTLHDVLGAAPDHVAFDVELKEPGYEQKVVSEVLSHVDLRRVVITSAFAEALRAVKLGSPAVRVGLIVGPPRASRAPLFLRFLALGGEFFPFARLRSSGADFLAPHVLLAFTLRHRARRRGIPLLIWTVYSPKQLRRYLRKPNILGVVADPAALSVVKHPGAGIWPVYATRDTSQ